MIPGITGLVFPRRCKPRASGDDPSTSKVKAWGGDVNPARAGMIRTLSDFPLPLPSKPRASGDDPTGDAGGTKRDG